MYLSTTVDRSITYRSRPSSPARTSADMVLPVPDSPANRALMPRPREPPWPRPQSSSTRSRRRTLATSSRSWVSTWAGSTRSPHATAGSTRRARRSRPAAFWPRTPARRSSSETARPWARARTDADRAARSRCSGGRRNWAARSMVGWPPRDRHRRRRRGPGPGCAGARPPSARARPPPGGRRRLHAGSQVRLPMRTSVRTGASARARTSGRDPAALGHRLDRTGHDDAAPQAGLTGQAPGERLVRRPPPSRRDRSARRTPRPSPRGRRPRPG